ncbi:uncharacterized protein LOC134687652 [Mytilus trossulus]|uniref:uncharacterized protein LOC134687652 n=1 Tax=Mytilus trossulus TaxID=6551 RepID=UPI003007D165
MSMDKKQSLDFYQFLCQKIGSEVVVSTRRIHSIISDIGAAEQKRITSGSNGEGLNFKSSDIDYMFLDRSFKVYESERDVVSQDLSIPFIMDTEDTQPCFTRLRLFHDKFYNIIKKNASVLLKNGPQHLLSSELYKLYHLKGLCLSPIFKVHGPCLSDRDDRFDLAYCLKCDNWVSLAKSWITRPRKWPHPDVISKIIACGVLFVPIGNKGSIYEHIEWRISFSVSEKIIIFSFNHTQLLCYALLKILLKEIIESHKDLKGLLCSYFLKTMLFWIAEESTPSIWRSDNIIPCVMACVKRLLYCVQYSTLLHYFIPDNNLFSSRFNNTNKLKLINILNNNHKKGIQCFCSTKTLCDFGRLSYEISEPFGRNIRIIEEIMHKFLEGGSQFGVNTKRQLNNLLHHSRTRLSREIFTLQMSKASQCVSKYPQRHHGENNRKRYSKYRYDLSNFLLGLSTDAVSGWLILACFFYVHKKYSTSLRILDYALSKCTDEKIYFQPRNCPFSQIQASVLNMMKREKLYTVLKTLTVQNIIFDWQSFVIPPELQLDVTWNGNGVVSYAPVPFAYFLKFLCHYHLHEESLCKHWLRKLMTSVRTCKWGIRLFSTIHSKIFAGIAYKMLGEVDNARFMFVEASISDFNVSSARYRLSHF